MKATKLVALFVTVVTVTSLTACGTPRMSTPEPATNKNITAKTIEGPTFHLSMATSAAEGAVVDLTMKYAKKIIEERSGGKITLDLFPAAQLGSDHELVEACRIGNISMVIGATSPQVSFVPALAVFDLPNAIPDLKTAKTVLSDFQATMGPEYAKANLKLLNLYPFLYRYMSSNKEVQKIDDLAGIKIRTMDNQYHMSYWESLGAKPLALNTGELYTALQQKLVDAQENPLDVILNAKLYEQQKYIINTKHIVFVTAIIMNQKEWDSLPSQYQALLAECLNEARDYAISIAQEKETGFRKALIEKGVQFIDLDDSVRKQMADRSLPVYDKIRQNTPVGIADNLLASIKKAQAN